MDKHDIDDEINFIVKIAKLNGYEKDLVSKLVINENGTRH